MKTKIYLVRHSNTTGNVEHRFTGRKDYEITQYGNELIDKLTDKLKDIKFQKAFSSTSGRTKKTIQKLADMNGLDIVQYDDLCEMYFGIYDGMKWDEVSKINPEIDKLHKETNEIMSIPNQETSEQVAKRMFKVIKDISEENIGKTILICSHGVAIEAFLRKITEVPFVQKREEYSQKNTSINIIEYDENKGFEALVINDKTHIE